MSFRTGTPVSHSLNGGGSPSGEDYVAVGVNGFGVARWNDLPDAVFGVPFTRFSVIEFDTDPAIPEPKLYGLVGMLLGILVFAGARIRRRRSSGFDAATQALT